MSFYVAINLIVFVGLIVFLARLRGPDFPLSRQILAGLVAGVVFGLGLQYAYDGNPAAIEGTLTWTNVIGSRRIQRGRR